MMSGGVNAMKSLEPNERRGLECPFIADFLQRQGVFLQHQSKNLKIFITFLPEAPGPHGRPRSNSQPTLKLAVVAPARDARYQRN